MPDNSALAAKQPPPAKMPKVELQFEFDMPIGDQHCLSSGAYIFISFFHTSATDIDGKEFMPNLYTAHLCPKELEGNACPYFLKEELLKKRFDCYRGFQVRMIYWPGSNHGHHTADPDNGDTQIKGLIIGPLGGIPGEDYKRSQPHPLYMASDYKLVMDTVGELPDEYVGDGATYLFHANDGYEGPMYKTFKLIKTAAEHSRSSKQP